MSVALFTGIETYNWQMSDFATLASFCNKYGVRQVILKVYEITQGEWYSSLGGPGAVVSYLNSQHLDVLTYGFYYGDDIVTETSHIKAYLNSYGKHCLDMEGSFDNNPNSRVEQFVSQLNGHTGELYISTWANPEAHGWVGNILLLDPITSVWMPQAYDDNLVKDMYAQFPRLKVGSQIWPTFHVIDTPYQDSSPYNNFSLWEYELAQTAVTSLLDYIMQNEGEMVSTYPTNSRRMILNALPNGMSEFQPGHTEFACGAFSVSTLLRSSNYNVPNTFSETNAINWAESEYAKTAGDNGPSNTVGASIADMHMYLKDSQSDPSGGLHYWDTDISTVSQQDHDIATIKAALAHGFPVIATVSEQSVFDLDLGRNPYWWGPSGNHILVWVGVASDGNLLACDCANVIKGDGNLQTPKNVQPWPRRYDISRIDNQWASVIRPHWIASYPQSGPGFCDPISWPPYTPPAPPVPANQGVQLVYDPNSKQIIFNDTVTNQAIYRIQL